MNTRKVSHKGARKKGSRLERDITKSLKNIGIDAKRVPLSGALSWLKGDVTEFDTIKPHLHECKNCESLELPSWWRQTTSQTINGEVPVLHFTSNYQKIFTVLPVADFDDLVFSYEKYRPELTLTLVDFPQRKNFWKFVVGKNITHHVFLYKVDEIELALIPLEMYLMLRRWDIKRRAEDVLQPAPAPVLAV
jgi:hypothetical protein